MLFGNTLKKLKAKKIYREDVRHVKKNLKCFAGSTVFLFGHLQSYHQKICKEAEDKREEAGKQEEKKPDLQAIYANKKQDRLDECFTSLLKYAASYPRQ